MEGINQGSLGRFGQRVWILADLILLNPANLGPTAVGDVCKG